MSATEAMRVRLRRMVDEPTITPYSHAMLDTIIEMVASASDDDPTELKEMIEAALVVNAGKGQLYVM